MSLRRRRNERPIAGIEAEEKLMHKPDRFAHSGDGKVCDGADNHRQHVDARFTRAHDRAQSVRHFERAAEQMHPEQIQAGEPRHWLKFHDAFPCKRFKPTLGTTV